MKASKVRKERGCIKHARKWEHVRHVKNGAT